MRLYVDGSLKASGTATFPLTNQTVDLRIGAESDNSSFMNGLIDEVRVTAAPVYSSDFTAQHRLVGIVATKGLWRFDSQNVKDCADIHTGTLVGGATFSTDVP
jgi:hypothetical protein